MAQEENLLKNSFRTDLACESRDVWLRTRGAALAGVSARQETRDGLGVETVEILDEGAAEELCKPMGRYITISLDALVRREEDAFRRACGVLCALCGGILDVLTHCQFLRFRNSYFQIQKRA